MVLHLESCRPQQRHCWKCIRRFTSRSKSSICTTLGLGCDGSLRCRDHPDAARRFTRRMRTARNRPLCCSHATISSSGTQACGFRARPRRRKNGSNLAGQYSSRADGVSLFLGWRQVFGVGRYAHRRFRLPVCRQRDRACHHRPVFILSRHGVRPGRSPNMASTRIFIGLFLSSQSPALEFGQGIRTGNSVRRRVTQISSLGAASSPH